MIELRFATTAPSMNPGNCSSSPSRRRRMMALKQHQQQFTAEESMTTASIQSNRLVANHHHRTNHKNHRNSRPTTTTTITKMNSFILLTAATASLLLLLLPCPISAEEGLLFQNELNSAPLSSRLRNSLSNQEHSNNQQQLYSSKERPHGHPIHRIYRTGAPIRRRMEQLENTMSYYQTGFREIDHLVNYGGRHPFERMRFLNNEEREGSDG
eukprot:scaffold42399_cov133-Skeletonema_dohrnii-CCMP3373.AAC.1